jgi:hypothetical protein
MAIDHLSKSSNRSIDLIRGIKRDSSMSLLMSHEGREKLIELCSGFLRTGRKPRESRGN